MPVATCSAMAAGPLPSMTQAIGGRRVGGVLGRGEHGAVGALGGGHAVGGERERDRGAGRERPGGGGRRQRGGGRAHGRRCVVRRRGCCRGRGGRAGATGREERGGGEDDGGRGNGEPEGPDGESGLQMSDAFPRHRASIASASGDTVHAMATTRDISYEADDRTMIGTLAVPDGDGQRPGVLVCHEGPGLDDHARGRGGPARRRARVRGVRPRLPGWWEADRGSGADDGAHRRVLCGPAASARHRHGRTRDPVAGASHRPTAAGGDRLLLRRHPGVGAGAGRGRPQGGLRLPLRARARRGRRTPRTSSGRCWS